jgi:RNA polymerase sigma-70 factor (ECF subfamily)
MQVVAVREMAQGDASGLEGIFLEHQGRVFRAAYRITGNAQDAEDVLQTVFLRLARREERELAPRNLPSYLYRAAINAALDLLRARKHPESVALEDAEGSLPENPGLGPERLHEAGEIRRWLRRALARLGPRAAEVFALRYLEDYDNREIARMLGTSRLTVAVTLHRARFRLRQELLGMTRGKR